RAPRQQDGRAGRTLDSGARRDVPSGGASPPQSFRSKESAGRKRVQEDYTLLTPENVELRYPVAGVGSRLVAATIDYTVLSISESVISFAIFFVFGLVGQLFPRSTEVPAVAAIAGFASVAAAVLLVFL